MESFFIAPNGGARIPSAPRGPSIKITKVESKFFIVTKDGVVLPKGAKIPWDLKENTFRSSSYGVIKDGTFIEKIRIDPARFAEPSHFHLNGKGTKLTKWSWF